MNAGCSPMKCLETIRHLQIATLVSSLNLLPSSCFLLSLVPALSLRNRSIKPPNSANIMANDALATPKRANPCLLNAQSSSTVEMLLCNKRLLSWQKQKMNLKRLHCFFRVAVAFHPSHRLAVGQQSREAHPVNRIAWKHAYTTVSITTVYNSTIGRHEAMEAVDCSQLADCRFSPRMMFPLGWGGEEIHESTDSTVEIVYGNNKAKFVGSNLAGRIPADFDCFNALSWQSCSVQLVVSAEYFGLHHFIVCMIRWLASFLMLLLILLLHLGIAIFKILSHLHRPS